MTSPDPAAEAGLEYGGWAGDRDAVHREARQGQAAAALRLAGATYPDIADALSFPDAKAARGAVEAFLANNAMTTADRDKLRTEEATRLERLLRSVWAKATNVDHVEHLAAVKVALAIINQHTRLYGLEAPAEVVVHNPTMVEIEAWVMHVAQRESTDLLALEASVVGDEPATA